MISQIKQDAEFSGKLAALAGMLKLQDAITWFLRAAILGLATDSVMLFVARYKAFTPATWLLAAVPIGCVLVGIAFAVSRPLSSSVVAARTDHALTLKERLTTALELQSLQALSVLARAQIADAQWYAQRIDPWRTFPPRLPQRETMSILGAILVMTALVLIPNPAKQAIERQAAVSNAIQQEAQKLQRTANEIKQNEAQTGNHSQDEQNVDSILNDLQKQLHQPNLTAEQALAQLQAAQQRLQANIDSNADALSEALQALAANFDNQQLLKQTAQDIRNGDYNAAARDLRTAGNQASSLSQEQRDSLAASLRAAAAAQAKAGSTQLSDSLGQASDSLSGSEQDSSVAFSQAANSLQNAGQRSQAQQNAGKASDQVRQSQSAISNAAGQSASGSSASDSASSDDMLGDSSQQGNSSQTGSGQGGDQGSKGQGDGSGSGSQGSETVYTGSTSHMEGVPGQQGPNGEVASQDDSSLSDPINNGSNVPYQQVVGQYQQQASQAMDRGAVPLSYRQIVKDYFSSLSSRS